MMAGTDMENSMSEDRSAALREAWSAVSKQASAAVSWINSTRHVKKVDNEADDGIEKLYCVKNEADRMLRVAGTAPALGLFGPSQAGKSFLVSSLAASADGRLRTKMGDTVLDFIDDINPRGNGKESTGLVTRFTRKGEPEKDPKFCVPLRLFGECDIAKILINSCFNDFDWHEVKRKSSLANAMRKLDEAKSGSACSISPSGCGSRYAAKAFPPEMVVDLREYVRNGYRNDLEFLDDDFWRRAVNELPQLDIDSRAEVLSELWNEEQLFTNLYKDLAHDLEKLEYSHEVRADIGVIYNVAEKKNAGMRSLMNVDALKTLGLHDQDNVTVVTEHGTKADINRAELAALTHEIRIVLIDEPKSPAARNLEILDFPGYRNRLTEGKPETNNLSYEHFLRGKVAFLFEQYTDDNEINMLTVCTPSDAQLEVNIAKVLNRWIDKAQGKDPAERALHKPGLFWAITKFDKRIDDELKNNSEHQFGRAGLLQQTVLEKFGKAKWFNSWNPGKPFGNIFLVRKPGWSSFLISKDQDSPETGIRPEKLEKLEEIREAFINDEDVRSHIDSPEEKWKAVMGLNDGGMELLNRAIGLADGESLKLAAMQNLLNESVESATKKVLGKWYRTPEKDQKELEKRKLIAANFLSPLLKRESGTREDSPEIDGRASLGLVLKMMNLAPEEIRSACEEEKYSSVPGNRKEPQSASVQEAEKPSAPEREASLDDLFSDDALLSGIDETAAESGAEPAKKNEAPADGGDGEVYSPLAEAIYRKWLRHMRSLPDDPAVKLYCSGWKRATRNGPVSMAKALIEQLSKEMIDAAERDGLKQRLAKAILENEKNGIDLDEARERNVSSISNILSDFIAWLGAKDEVKDGGDGKKDIFKRAETDEEGHPVIREECVPFRRNFVSDWTEQYVEVVDANVMTASGRDPDGISDAENDALGKIIAAFPGQKV